MAQPHPSSSPSAPPSSSPWVILGSIPRVSAALADAGDVSVALTAPPRVSILNVSTRVFPDAPTPRNFPFVLAADPSGLLLLQANLRVDRPGHQGVTWKLTDSRYFVLDATTGSSFHLPDPQAAIMHQALLGLLASPGGGGHYMVAELRPLIGSDEATLLCFSTEVGEWVEKHVHYPLPPRPLSPICVVSHHGRLWWVDLSWGVITCDPFADEPVLGFVPFPTERVLKYREAWGITDKFRYVGVSDGKLRFVDIYMGKRAGGGGTHTPMVGVWTLGDPDSREWTLEQEVSFAKIWGDESYKATGLPKKIPTVALIHPRNPDVVYFFLKEQLFGVDVRARKVVECQVYGLVAPPSICLASRFVRAWSCHGRSPPQGSGVMASAWLKALMHVHTSHRQGIITWWGAPGSGHELEEHEAASCLWGELSRFTIAFLCLPKHYSFIYFPAFYDLSLDGALVPEV